MLAAKFGSVFPHLDERQRRLLLGAEARVLGHGGIRLVAAAAGVREATVSLGVSELESGEGPLGRARREGGGRKQLAETDPGLVPALLALVEPDERGDPESPLRWTVKSTRTLAGALTRQGHPVSAETVDRLLHQQGFSLQANAKTIEGRQHPDRDGQFRYINEQARAHRDAGDPVISVDAKKKEQAGQYASPGRTWRPKGDPVRVRDHDFPDDGTRKAIPYGIYDLAANTGWVNVGTDHDTAAFAVESIRRWWKDRGSGDYPAARRLLITADAGGSNGYRTRAWKAGLAALAAGTGLEITCCHFPPGTSKWNKIEHRLFSAITMNWRGRPLASHEIIVNSIAATTTRTGLAVHAELDPGACPAGATISRAELDALPLARHDWHGDWNYTLHPQPAAQPAPAAAPPRSRAARPGPDLAWLTRPAITGLPGPALDALTAALAGPAAALRETAADRRRGYRPRRGHGRGGRPRHTLTAKLSAAILHHRHGLPQKHIAVLYQTSPAAISRHIGDIRRLLAQTGNTITPAPHTLATLDDLCQYAARHGITIPPEIKPAC
ncbi:MAG TPA: ISAzo13 family transposase [Streptosporangiaceae bacterium]|nr:ISAzo13 family transposase [Streptosporangiaceae bacterium]